MHKIKPRISFGPLFREWICTDGFITGYGSTPSASYKDFQNQFRIFNKICDEPWYQLSKA